MRMRFLAALLLVPLPLAPMSAQAQLYRWVDDQGKVHYSDQAPSSGAKNVQKQAAPPAPAASAGLPYALQQAVQNFPVTLYTSDACKDTCAQARELLNKRGVPYSEVTVADEVDIAELKKLSGGTVVPVMTVGRELYKGYESAMYKTALDAAGYPGSSLLPPGVEARKPAPKPVRKAAPPAGGEGAPAAAPQATGDTAAPK